MACVLKTQAAALRASREAVHEAELLSQALRDAVEHARIAAELAFAGRVGQLVPPACHGCGT